MKFRVGKFIAEKVEVIPRIFSPQRDENGEIEYTVNDKEITSIKDLMALVDDDKTAIVIYPKGFPLGQKDYKNAILMMPL
nr:MAG TPA: hypothetical protein [Caudoviricetes sp.]